MNMTEETVVDGEMTPATDANNAEVEATEGTEEGTDATDADVAAEEETEVA